MKEKKVGVIIEMTVFLIRILTIKNLPLKLPDIFDSTTSK